MKKIIIAISFCVALAACASEPPRPSPIQMDYSSLGKIYLDTQDMKVIDRTYSTSQRAHNVDRMFKPKLVEAINRWSSDRLQAVGTTGHATFIIKEANIVEQGLPVDSGFDGWFKRQQDRKYTGRIEVEVEAQTPIGGRRAFASAYAIHAITLPEKPTEAEKSSAYKTLLEALMSELNQKIEISMREHMASFIVEKPQGGNSGSAAPLSMQEQQPLGIMPENQNAPSLNSGTR